MLRNLQDLLDMAYAQDEPQRLLLVLAKTQSRASGATMQTGTLTPMICTDKLPSEIDSFVALVAEADEITPDWDMMLIASLDGAEGRPRTGEEAAPHLDKMVNDVLTGQDLSRYLILDRDEQVVTMQLRDGIMMI